MAEEEAIKTAFHDVTEELGGSHTADGGWMWLDGFGDVQKEYAAVRDDVAVWDVSPLNKWDFRGPDALAAASSPTTRCISRWDRRGTARSSTRTA